MKEGEKKKGGRKIVRSVSNVSINKIFLRSFRYFVLFVSFYRDVSRILITARVFIILDSVWIVFSDLVKKWN